MGNMNSWDVVLIVVAGYVAAMALVRLMIRRRDQLLDEFRRQVNMQRKSKRGNVDQSGILGDRSKVA